MRGLTTPERDLLAEALKLTAEKTGRQLNRSEVAIADALTAQGRFQDVGNGWTVTQAGREALRIDGILRASTIR